MVLIKNKISDPISTGGPSTDSDLSYQHSLSSSLPKVLTQDPAMMTSSESPYGLARMYRCSFSSFDMSEDSESVRSEISSDDGSESLLCINGGTTKTQKQRSIPLSSLPRGHLFIALIIFAFSMALKLRCSPAVLEDSVYVPGAGFSGFWFTMGRLQSIPEPREKTYYCFSAGCLGVVAHLSNYTMEEMYAIASDAQMRWKNGDIHRYEVVSAFVDDLLFGRRPNDSVASPRASLQGPWYHAPLHNSTLLSRLRVITTENNGGWITGLRTSIRTPTDMSNLREMLIQTTWIPYAVGGGLWYRGHMDGGVSWMHHPSCELDMGLPSDIDLLANIVNVNLSRNKVEKFWKAGLAYDL